MFNYAPRHRHLEESNQWDNQKIERIFWSSFLLYFKSLDYHYHHHLFIANTNSFCSLFFLRLWRSTSYFWWCYCWWWWCDDDIFFSEKRFSFLSLIFYRRHRRLLFSSWLHFSSFSHTICSCTRLHFLSSTPLTMLCYWKKEELEETIHLLLSAYYWSSATQQKTQKKRRMDNRIPSKDRQRYRMKSLANSLSQLAQVNLEEVIFLISKMSCVKKNWKRQSERNCWWSSLPQGSQTDEIDKHTSGKRTIYYMYVNEATMMARKKFHEVMLFIPLKSYH